MGYWYDYYQPSKPRKVKDGIKAKSKRGDIGEKWWSKRWVGVLESFSASERLARGRSYARKGQVASIDIKRGLVSAKVQGSMPKPYNITIKLALLSEKEWNDAVSAMASQAIFAAKLLSGEMPQNIEDAFCEAKTSLLPKSKGELKTECSCPDYENPCKHIAAVYYILAERFDEDPFLIFALRGKTKDEVMNMIRERRGTSQEGRMKGEVESVAETQKIQQIPSKILSLEKQLDTFWDSGRELLLFSAKPEEPGINATLKMLGDAPFDVRGENASVALAKIYDTASRRAMSVAMGEEK